MRDYIDLGPVPCGENCEQLGDNYNPQKARKECRAYINQLIRQFGEPPGNARFKIQSNPHDFGTYHDVAIVFNDNNEEEIEFAYMVEENLPEQWDEIAKKELEND